MTASRRSIGAALLVAILLVGARALAPDPLTSRIEDTLIDLRFQLRGPLPAPQGVAILAMDEPSLSAIGLVAPMREALAEAIPKLEAAGAAAIGVDLLLLGRTPADARLAAALSMSPRTVLAVAAVEREADALPPETRAALARSAFRVDAAAGAGPPAPPDAQPLLAPPPLLAEAAALGHVNLDRPSDRLARRAPLALALPGGGALPALPLAVSRLALELPPDALALWRGEGVRLGDRAVATDAGHRVLVNHYGPAGVIPTTSLLALLRGETPPETFAGRAVLVGATAPSLGDVFATPFAPDAPGVEVLATLTANLIDGELIETGGRLWAATAGLALCAAALACLAALASTVPAVAAAATAAVWVGAAAVVQTAFAAGAALDATAALGATLLASAIAWLARLRAERAGARLVAEERETLSVFVSPLASATLSRGGEAARWRTEEATVAFVDVVDSVSLAEGRSPAETAVFLAAVQEAIARVAAARGGAVVERFGDGALVVFGFSGGAGAREALGFAAAVGANAPEGARFRVSVHHGPVALADVGGSEWGHVTVAGDTVNVAARLQEAARRAGAAVVAGRAALDAAGEAPGAGPWRPLPPESVRGRRAPVEVWARDA